MSWVKILLFGATGMLGHGALRESLRASDVDLVRSVGRSRVEYQSDPKLDQIVHSDLFDLQPIEEKLRGFDACFFCLGVSSAGMGEADYRRLTYELTTGIAHTLERLNPNMAFVYVSGAGTDSTESGRVMWARVKGATENELLRMSFSGVYLFRPGIIQPVHGARSKTISYRLFYSMSWPLLSLLRRLFPRQILTTDIVGRAMLSVARTGAPEPVLHSADIYRIGR